jgi:hypothetical protein
MTAELKCACEFDEILGFSERLTQLCKVQDTIFSHLFRLHNKKFLITKKFLEAIGLCFCFNLIAYNIKSTKFICKKFRRKRSKIKKEKEAK